MSRKYPNSFVNQRGLALIIVILILTALMVIAAPFIISMVFKEKTGRDTFHQTKTAYSAAGARNYAAASLYQTHNFYETSPNAAPPFNTPDYDTLDEFKVAWQTYGLDTAMSLNNPKGEIWDVKVQDEQEKINILTAPLRLLNNFKKQPVLQLPGPTITDFITEHSGRPANWVDSRNLRGYINLSLIDGNAVTTVILDVNQAGSALYDTAGAKVRLSLGSNLFFANVMPLKPCRECGGLYQFPVAEHQIHRQTPSPVRERLSGRIWMGSGTAIMLDRLVPDSFLTPYTVVNVAQRHPVNINTASEEVLLAILTGVGNREGTVRRVASDDRISEPVAGNLAKQILETRPIKEPSEYKNLLENNQSLTSTQKSNLLSNGLVPFIDFIEETYTETVPFCYRSYDKYTIISTGIINYLSGKQAARSTFREIADISPPRKLRWGIESQYDFDQAFAYLNANPEHFITFPNLTTLGPIDIFNSTPSHSREPDSGELKLRTAVDNRGRNVILSEHFSGTHEGQLLGGQPLTYERGRIFSFNNNLDVTPGGVEMWVKFTGGVSDLYFFDIKQREYENRISLQYAGGELILTACDATVERKTARIRAPVNFEADTWYHLGAYWKGTKYAQMALMVDGQAVGSFAHYDDSNLRILTELSADLTDRIVMTNQNTAGLIVPVQSTAGFPAAGVIEIGDEVIEYDSVTGQEFNVTSVWDSTISPTRYTYIGRGVRGSTIKSHPAGAKVTIYGYRNILINQIRISGYPVMNYPKLYTGGASLNINLIDYLPQTTIFKPEIIDPNTGQVIQTDGIGATETIIPVDSTNDFPAEGYLRIDDEVIFYNGLGATRIWISPTQQVDQPVFMNCQRGQAGTTAANHSHDADVDLFSIKVDNNSNYPDRGIIQIDDEWIGPLQKQGTDYFIGIINNGQPLNINRGYGFTAAVSHNTGTAIIPVFRVADEFCGSGDIVTIVEADQSLSKEERTVNHAADIAGNYLVALTENISREYTIDNITRLLKFPSDELPSYLPAQAYVGGECPDEQGVIATTGLTGYVDELRFFQAAKGNFTLNGVLSAAGNETAIPMNNVSDLFSAGGVVKVGDEFIGYGGLDINNNEIIYCQRGYLKSPVSAQDPDQRAFHLSFLPVAALSRDVSADDYTVSVNIAPGSSGGYILIDDEVVGFTGKTSGNQIVMPYDKNWVGLFRGAFGTDRSSHQQNALVFQIPHRYWDLYQSDAFDDDMAYCTFTNSANDALWGRVTWEQQPTRPQVRLKIMARVDGAPDWSTPPTNRPGGLFEFTDSRALNLLNAPGDELEIMVFYEYLQGAFSTNAWKESPVLKGLWVEYEKQNNIVTHQEE